MPKAENVITGAGMLAEEVIRGELRRFPLKLALAVRRLLAEKIPGLREKLNHRSRYLGYGLGRRDRLYIYIQRKRLRVDINVPLSAGDQFRRLGFVIKPVANFQARS